MKPIDHGQHQQAKYATCSCLGKQALSPGLAQKIAARQRRTGKGSSNAYRCRTCGQWHVGAREK